MRIGYERLATAYHEAGHAVVATLLGYPHRHHAVQIYPTSIDGADGRASISPPHEDDPPDVHKAYLSILWAGGEAERRHLGERFNPESMKQDGEEFNIRLPNYLKRASGAAPDKTTVETAKAVITAEVAEIVDKHWTGIVEIANELHNESTGMIWFDDHVEHHLNAIYGRHQL